ncbi:MAG TPA: AAA family ATPase [Planctomicrobium sp.]|nr:AAA family ATPase [Planctomicrobium sp.]
MTTTEALADLQQRIRAGYSILLLRTYEEQRWEELLANLALEMEQGLVTWSSTAGPSPVLDAASTPRSVVDFLAQIPRYPHDHLFLLKDLHPHLATPEVNRQLRDLLPVLAAHRKTVLLMSPVTTLPVELVKDVSIIDLPLPGTDDLRDVLQSVLTSRLTTELTELSLREQDRFVQAVLGLTEDEARRAYAKVFQNADSLSEELFPELVAEKRHLIQGSNLLEFFDLDEGLGDVGGLDGLKEWVQQRSNAFTPDARTRGITNPRGVLLAGVQGCGKSLCARVIARIFGFPLIRMDIGALLEGTRGGSEQNLRDVLRLIESISPAVLWLEEIDKAFAGFDDEASNDATMSRLVGRFLTWLQEHSAPVFVVATANNVSKLPPEMLRRGRFDELFFVDLPNYHERLDIFRVHLSKRGWKPEKFDVEALSDQTDGFSGAEIEQVVNSAIIEAHAGDRLPTQQDIEAAREQTIPLSVTMEDEIFQLREWARTRCRAATLDFRVMQVMEEEQRKGEMVEYDRLVQPRWMQLAEHGQYQGAIQAYVESVDHVLWGKLLQEFEQYFPTRGDYGLVLKADPKIVICVRLSRDMADLVAGYLDGRRLYLHPVTSSEVPEADRPSLPALEKMPEEKVTRPTWLPTKLRVLPPHGGSGRLSRVARIRMGK